MPIVFLQDSAPPIGKTVLGVLWRRVASERIAFAPSENELLRQFRSTESHGSGIHRPISHGNLYGTLFNVPNTATHVVCPVCGKSSSLKTFPAGGGKDLVLQTYRSLGRGKGFAVSARESGIGDRRLGSALAPKVLQTLTVLAAHGHTSIVEVLAAVGREGLAEADERASKVEAKNRSLEAEISADRKARGALDREVAELHQTVARALRQWQDGQRQVAILQRRLDRLGETNERLVGATRAGVESLQNLRDELKDADRGAKELADHVRKMRAIVEAVQALRAANKDGPGERRADHDAR